MQSKKARLVLLVLIGIGVVAVSVWWWLQHRSHPSPLPSETGAERVASRANNAEKATADSSEWARRRLPRLEDSDDVELITRVFKEANDCLLYHMARSELNAVLNDERLGDLSAETLATIEDIDATSSHYVSVVRQTENFCSGSDRDVVAQAYSDAIFRAALLDSPDAQTCFVISTISPLETTPAAAYAFLERRYLEHAPSFTKSALERFDPYVAKHALDRHTASPGVHPSKLDNMPKADPYLTWQVARLASLRALPEQRARLEQDLALFEEQHLLSADEIERADAWAEAAYKREFSRQPPVDLARQVPCYSDPDLAP